MIYIAITFFSLITFYAIGNFFLYTLPVLEAGPISGVKRTGLHRMHERITASYKKTKQGVSCWYRRFVIQGECMIKIGINPKSVVSVRMFSDSSEKDNLREGDAVVIFLNDKKFRGYKVRIIETINDGKAETYYFDKEGNKKPSSEPHSLINIIGVVDFEESGIAA